MKKNILLGVIVFGQMGLAFSQASKIQRSLESVEFSTETPKPTINSNTQKALGFTFYHDNFDSIVGGAGLTTQLGLSNWVINNSGQTGPTFGWTIDNVKDGWWAPATAIASSSEGKFAEVGNGNPTSGFVTQAIGVTYTMTSGPIDVMTLSGGSDEVSLSFQQYGAKFNDNQQVFISVDGLAWQLVGSNANKPITSEGNNNPYPNPDLVSINLAPFIAGNASSVYIRFSWTSISPSSVNPSLWVAYGWYIDDLKLSTNADSEVAVTEVMIGDIVNDFSYSQMPINQAIPLTVGVALRNDGIADMTAANVNISIKLNGTEVSNFDEPITLMSGMADTFWISSNYTPTALGDYTITATLPSDDNLANNTATSLVTKVTQYIYGHDYNGIISRGFNQDEETAMGNLYLINNDQEVSGVNVRFRSGTTVGQEVEVALYAVTDVNSGVQGTLDFVNIAYYSVQQTDITAPFTIVRFDTPVTLTAGTVYLVYVKKQAGSDRLYLASTLTGDNDNSTVCYGPFAAGNAINYFPGWGWSPHVRLNFDPSLAIENVSLLDGVKVYPNPSNGLITVSNENGSQNTITVLDITGKVVATRVANTSVEMDLNSFGSGVYMVEIANENGKKAERVVIR